MASGDEERPYHNIKGDAATEETIRRRKAKHEYYIANREHCLELSRKWRQKNRLAMNDRYKRTKVKYRHWQIRNKYGLSVEQYNEMREAQGGRCAICRLPFSKEPHVDHDHTTGAVRDLLCADCNLGLGRFKDSPDLLASAITYLAKHTHKAIALVKEA